VPEHGWENTFWIITTEGERIGVAHAGVRDANQHLAGARRLHIDFDDF
jgi:hypothetical protein